MTRQEAREIYLNSDCSYFKMCTNHYSSYIQYRRLELPKEQEDIWKHERIQTLYWEMHKTGDYRLFDRLYEIAVEFRDYKNLLLMLEALKRIKYPLTPAQSISVAETILGKRNIKVRSGLIYWAYDNGQKGIAILFMDEALELLNYPNLTDEALEKRVRKGHRICKRIIAELKLNFSKQYLMHCYHF